MSDHSLPDDGLDPVDGDLLTRLRPAPPRTWRDRLDDLAADPPPPSRVAVGVIVVALVALVAWRVLAPPPAPSETTLPLAQPASGSTVPGASAAADHGGVPASAPSGDGSSAGSTSPVAPGAVVVHVVGAVAAPGVQRLPAGARVVDAIEAAGGAAADADLARVNLAAALVDGQQVVVLRPGEAPPPTAGAPGGGAGAEGASADGALVNINTASAAELDELPGVGPTTAEAIIAHRDRNGPFISVDDLLDVRGIGEAKLEQLRDRATV